MNKKFDEHYEAIKKVLEKYQAQKLAVGFPGCLFTMLEGCQKLERSATEYISACRLYMKVLDQITDLVGHIGGKISEEDFEQLKSHYSEIQFLFSTHYAKTKERVCGKQEFPN